MDIRSGSTSLFKGAFWLHEYEGNDVRLEIPDFYNYCHWSNSCRRLSSCRHSDTCLDPVPAVVNRSTSFRSSNTCTSSYSASLNRPCCRQVAAMAVAVGMSGCLLPSTLFRNSTTCTVPRVVLPHQCTMNTVAVYASLLSNLSTYLRISSSRTRYGFAVTSSCLLISSLLNYPYPIPKTIWR